MSLTLHGFTEGLILLFGIELLCSEDKWFYRNPRMSTSVVTYPVDGYEYQKMLEVYQYTLARNALPATPARFMDGF